MFSLSREAAAAVYLLLRKELTISDLAAFEYDSGATVFGAEFTTQDEASS
jgi:hypothetical protein